MAAGALVAATRARQWFCNAGTCVSSIDVNVTGFPLIAVFPGISTTSESWRM